MPSWKQRAVGIAVLCLLGGLPVATTTCALVCSSAQTAAALAPSSPAESVHHHHHEASHTDYQALSVTGPQLASAGAHDCGAPDDVIPQGVTATMAWREDARARTLLSAGLALPSTGSRPSICGHASEGQRPHEAASSPVSPPLVLRV